MITLYDAAPSGHCHRARLLLGFLGVPYTSVPVLGADRKSDDYLRLNPFGEVPTLVDGDVVIPDSSAILVYLARTYDPTGTWAPTDAVAAARVARWMSFASGEVVYGIAKLRASYRWNRPLDRDAAAALGTRALEHVDAHLATRDWLAADHPTIADLAVFSYVQVADEARLPLADFGNVTAWIRRIEALPGFTPIERIA